MSLVTVNCKSAVNKTVAISVVRHSMSSTNVTYTFKKKHAMEHWSKDRPL